jgi:hypothetical protein
MYYLFLPGFFAIFSRTMSKNPVFPLFSPAPGVNDIIIGPNLYIFTACQDFVFFSGWDSFRLLRAKTPSCCIWHCLSYRSVSLPVHHKSTLVDPDQVLPWYCNYNPWILSFPRKNSAITHILRGSDNNRIRPGIQYGPELGTNQVCCEDEEYDHHPG